MNGLFAPTRDDLKSAMKREYRQRQEEERKARIFNPRRRLIGIDKSALDEHAEMKELERRLKANEEVCFAVQQERQNEQIIAQHSEFMKEKRRRERELNEFRSKYQRREQAREYYLNDPNYLQKVSPHQGFDFIGEDSDMALRQKLQKEQQKSWLEQQLYEKNLVNQAENKANQELELKSMSESERANQTLEHERQQRRRSQIETARYNLALARAQREQQEEQRRREYEDNMAEIMNHLSSDMLNENKESAVYSSLFGGRRVNPAMFRGLTDEEVKAIKDEQVRQIEQKRHESELAKKSEQMFDENVKQQNHLLEIEEQNLKRQKLQTLAEQKLLNDKLKREQKQRSHHLNEEVYKFKPTNEYFEQFNTTTR